MLICSFVPSRAETCRRARLFKLGGEYRINLINKEDNPILDLPSGFTWQDFEAGGYRGGFRAKLLEASLLSDEASSSQLQEIPLTKVQPMCERDISESSSIFWDNLLKKGENCYAKQPAEKCI